MNNRYDTSIRCAYKTANVLGTNIALLRQKQGVTQAELARRLSAVMGLQTPISTQTVSSWEQGRKHPSHETFRALADFFAVSEDFLDGRVKQPEIQYESESDPVDEMLLKMDHDLLIRKQDYMLYNMEPVFVTGEESNIQSRWAILVYTESERYLRFADSITELKAAKVRLYRAKPVVAEQMLELGVYPLSLSDVIQEGICYVLPLTSDYTIREALRGFYTYNAERRLLSHTETGYAYPLAALGKSFVAFSIGKNPKNNP